MGAVTARCPPGHLLVLTVVIFTVTCPNALSFSLLFSCVPLLLLDSGIAKGEINGAHAGRYSSILRHASSLCVDQPPPTVIIETQNNSTIIRDYNNVTVVMRDAGPEPTD